MGVPKEIFSDRDTNFVGTSRGLEEEIQLIIINIETQLRLNLLYTPNIGSLERMVRSVKRPELVVYSMPLTHLPINLPTITKRTEWFKDREPIQVSRATFLVFYSYSHHQVEVGVNVSITIGSDIARGVVVLVC